MRWERYIKLPGARNEKLIVHYIFLWIYQFNRSNVPLVVEKYFASLILFPVYYNCSYGCWSFLQQVRERSELLVGVIMLCHRSSHETIRVWDKGASFVIYTSSYETQKSEKEKKMSIVFHYSKSVVSSVLQMSILLLSRSLLVILNLIGGKVWRWKYTRHYVGWIWSRIEKWQARYIITGSHERLRRRRFMEFQ